jgi:hypothetical protein
MAHVRKSFEIKPSNYLIEEESFENVGQTNYTVPPKPEYNRGRHTSNEKKYNYQNEIANSREIRPRTPSASEHNKSKYESNFANGP